MRVCCVPVSVGDLLAVSQGYGAEGREQEIGIDGNRESLGVSVDSAQRNRETRTDLSFNSEGSLLRYRRTIAGLVHENNLQWREWAAVGYIDANWLWSCKWASYDYRRDTGIMDSGGGGALNQAPAKERLENGCRAVYAEHRNPINAIGVDG